MPVRCRWVPGVQYVWSIPTAKLLCCNRSAAMWTAGELPGFDNETFIRAMGVSDEGISKVVAPIDR
jgi:hypothetical protein